VNIGQTSGYGEYFQGLLNGTYSFVDLGSLTWTLTERYFRADLPIMPRTVNTSETPNAITDSQYQPIDFYSLYNNYGSYDDVFSITNGIAWSNKLYFRDTSYNDTIAFKTAMQGVYLIYELAKPSTPVTPEQFATLCQAFGITGNTYPITFGQTVYGGEYDARTGVLTITHGFIASYNGESIGVPWWSSMDEYVAGTTPTIGAQVVYTLATPIELTLTPAQLSLLQGTNILTSDGTINLTYLGSMASNVQDEIDEFESGLNNVIGSIAFIENSTAKTSHAVGEYIILNGIFCKVIASISSGETLSFGTNIQATTIGAELRAIWAEIQA
jgi:hypothetical protein